MLKKLLIGLSVFVGLILVLALVLYLIPLERYKPLIERNASDAIGRQVTVTGPLAITLFPMPGLSISGLQVANLPNAKDPQLATLGQLKAYVAFWPLFQKRVEISSISLKEPRVYLEKFSDGSNNWTFKGSESSKGAGAVQVSIKSIDVSDAHLSYRDVSGQSTFDVDNALLQLPDPTKITSDKLPVVFHAQMGETRLSTNFDLTKSTSTVVGKVDLELDTSLLPRLKKDLKVPAFLSDKIEIQSDVNASPERVDLNNLVATIRGQMLKGAVGVDLKGGLKATGDLSGFGGATSLRFEVQKHEQAAMTADLHAKVADLVAVLKWLDIKSDSIPAKMTKNLTLQTQIVMGEPMMLRNIDLAIGSARVQGSASVQKSGTGEAIAFNLTTPSADQILALIPRQLQNPIGAASIAGSLSGDAKHLRFNVTPSFASSTINLQGDAYDLGDKARVDTAINLKTSQLSSLMKVAGKAGIDHFENATVTGRINGNADAVTLDLKTQLEELALGLKGNIAALSQTPTLDLTVDASSPSTKAILSRFGFSPSKLIDGRLSVNTQVKGNSESLQMNPLKIAMGSALSASGNMTFNSGGTQKPSLLLSLLANAIDMESLFVSSESSSGPPWSSDPLNLSALDKMNADIDIKAPSLKRKDIIVQSPHMVIKIKDGTLNLAPLSGNIYGGAFSTNVSLTSAGVASLQSEVKSANLRNLSPKGANVKIVKGLLSANADLKTHGKSTREMISALNGKVDFSSTDGTLNGFNLKAISQQIGSYKDWTSVFSLLRTALGGGQTDFQSFNGVVNFNGGVGEIKSMTLKADASEMTAKGNINLPAYTLDVKGQVALTDHKDFPAIGVRLSGPIDSPSRELDTGALQGYLVKNVFGNLLQQVMGKPGTSDANTNTNTKTPSPGDLLNQIFGKKPQPSTPPPR